MSEAFEGSVSAVLKNKGEIRTGDTLEYRAEVTGSRDLVTIHWQVEAEDEQTHEKVWKDISTGERFSLTAGEENLAKKYRVALFDAEGNLCASSALALPEITAAEEEEIPEDADQQGPAEEEQGVPADNDAEVPADGKQDEPADDRQDEPADGDQDGSSDNGQGGPGGEKDPAEEPAPEEDAGVKLFAAPRRGSNEGLQPAAFELPDSGTPNIEWSYTMPQGDYHSFKIWFYDGFLSQSNGSAIGFEISNTPEQNPYGASYSWEAAPGGYLDSSVFSGPVYLFINAEDHAAAPIGTYSGILEWGGELWDGLSNEPDKISGSIVLTLTITGSSITIHADYGTVTPSVTSAREGQKVTLTAEPEIGRALTGISVTDGNGGSVSLTKKSALVYEFTMPGSDVTVDAVFGDAVKFIKTDGGPAWCSAYTPVTANGESQTWTTGWYVVDGNVSFGQKYIVISGDVNLILCDGCQLSTTAYIGVTGGNSLTVWGQDDGTGKLRSETSNYSFVAAIGGNDNSACGTVVINGGQITAKGSQGAGIGGGHGGMNNGTGGGSITINRGTVSASSGNGSAAIGGGNNAGCGAIVVNGGTVTASQSINNASAIGGTGGSVTINGGSVTAVFAGGYSGNKTGMIGGSGVTVAMNGGQVTGSQTGGIEGSGVTLSYTDDTKNSISIFSPIYTVRVTLEKDFMNDGGMEFFPAGEYAGSDLAGMTLVPVVFDWNTMQTMLDAGTAEITLPCDITAASSDAALTVPAGKTVTVDLNGHTISRGLDSARSEGSVIINNGTLTVTGSGVITGGYTSGDGGGIDNYGTLTLEGGTVKANQAEQNGGGIRNRADAVLTVTGGSISVNYANQGDGGAIYNGGILNLEGGSLKNNYAKKGHGGAILENGELNISGAPVISGDYDDGDNDVYLCSGKVFHVSGELANSDPIRVVTGTSPFDAGAVVFTSGLPGNGCKCQALFYMTW